MQEIKKIYLLIPKKNASHMDVYRDGWDWFTQDPKTLVRN